MRRPGVERRTERADEARHLRELDEELEEAPGDGPVEGIAVPGLGEDCYPMDWPLSLDMLLALSTAETVVVPGHGAPVGRDFVEEQRGLLGVVAETIRARASRGVPLGQALAAAEWPWPKESLRTAVERGYAQLPRAQKRLPLV